MTSTGRLSLRRLVGEGPLSGGVAVPGDVRQGRYPDTVTLNHAVFKRRAEAVAILAGERRAMLAE